MSFPFFATEIQIMTFPVNCGDKGPLITFPEKKRGIRVYEKVSYFHVWSLDSTCAERFL